MIYILLFSFIIAYVLVFIINQSFNSPISLLLLSFVMSLSLISANMENWQVEIKDNFPVCICISVLSFGAGCIAIKMIYEKKDKLLSQKCTSIEITGATDICRIVVFSVLPLLCTFGYVIMSIGIGKNGVVGNNIFRNIYEASVSNSSNFVLHQFREIVVAVAEVNTISILVTKYYDRKRIRITSFIPYICFVICTMLSTDRNIFLRFIIFFLSLWIFFENDTSERSKSSTNRRIFKRAAGVVLTSTIAFYFLGKIKSYTSNFERMIGIYGGSGLYNFNLCIDKILGADRQYGKETFSQLITTLKVFGINLGDGFANRIGLDMIIIRSGNGYVYASNIYSAMMPYVVDFGYIGVVVFPLIMGMFFQIIYLNGLEKKSVYLWGLYSMLVYSVVYFTIAEQFFMRLHLGLVYEVFWFSVLYFVSFGRKASISND